MKWTMLSIGSALLLALLLAGCGSNGSSSSETPSGPVFAIYDGEEKPACPLTLTRTDLVSPETVDTVHWGDPVKLDAPVNDACPNDDPEISADGQTLYYYWSPGLNLSNEELLRGTTGVYYAQRVGGPGEFGTPNFLELRKDTQYGAADGHPRLSPSGDRVYFHSTRAENTGYQQTPTVDDPLDIYTAALTGGSADPASNLGTWVNTVYRDGEPGISPDGLTLYFESYRPTGFGEGDIWVSTFSDGQWNTPVNIGAPINSPDNEGQVAFAANDPDTMYFTSDRDYRGSAIYSSHFDGTAWETPVLVVQGQVGSPSLTADGSILYFVHVLTDNAADPVFGADIYYILRN
jgi:Tol biopolymer transport system component